MHTLDAPSLRRPAVHCPQVQRLARLLDSVQEQRFLALPSSTAACDSCCASVQDAIFDMLMAPVAQVGAVALDAGCSAAVHPVLLALPM